MANFNPNPVNTRSTSTIGLYTRAVGTLVVTGLTSALAAQADGSINNQEWLTIAIAVVVSTTVVWAIPSLPDSVRHYGKIAAAAVTAFLSSIAVGLTDSGLSDAEWITAFIALLTAAGFVGVAKNAASSDPVDPTTKRIVPVSITQKAQFTSTGVAAGVNDNDHI